MERKNCMIWRRVCGAVLLLVLALPLLAQTAARQAPRDVLVRFRQRTPEAMQAVVRDHDIEHVKWMGGTDVLLLRSRSHDVASMVRALSARSDVLYAEPNYVVTKLDNVPHDPSYGSLWGMPKISAPGAWGLTTGSPTMVVGVVDTGIDYTHPDLSANVWSAPSAFKVTVGGVTVTCPAGSHGFNAITNTCDPKDDEDHGTHVSGTIGAVGNNGVGVVGVNWNTKIMALKFLDSTGSGYTSDAVDAIEFAVQVKGLFPSQANVRVLSNSWGGGGFSQTLYDEINRANAAGMVFVAAAGNSGRSNDASPSYPANYNSPNVVAVAATDSADNLASWSNYGATTVGLAAPGVSILSTIRVASGSYAFYSGTSMATPHVSGAAALILTAPGCGTLTPAGLRSVLLSNVDAIPSLAGRTLSSGRLNVLKAIQNCVPAPDFSISMSPATRSVRVGSSTSYTGVVNPVFGFKGTVTLTLAGGLPTGATGSFTGSTLNVTTTSRTSLGTYSLLIKGSSGTLVRSTTATLVVTR